MTPVVLPCGWPRPWWSRLLVAADAAEVIGDLVMETILDEDDGATVGAALAAAAAAAAA